METVFSMSFKSHEIVIQNDGSQLVTQIFKNGGPIPGFNLPSSNDQLGTPPYYEEMFDREITACKHYINAAATKDKRFLVAYRYYRDDSYITGDFIYPNDEMLGDDEVRRIILTWRANNLQDRSNIQINNQRQLTKEEILELGI